MRARQTLPQSVAYWTANCTCELTGAVSSGGSADRRTDGERRSAAARRAVRWLCRAVRMA